MRSAGCEVCLGSDFEVHPASVVCRRRLRRCRNCGLVEKVAGPAASVSRTPLSRRDPRIDQRRAALARRLLPEGRLLEICCGEGYFLAALDPLRHEVVGVEPDPQRANEALRRIRDAGLRGGVATVDFQSASFEPERFDLVAMFGHLSRSPSPRALLTHAVRLLRNGGFVVIETPGLSSWTARLMGSKWGPFRDPSATYFFTQRCLGRLLLSCGFQPGETKMTVPAGWPPPGTLLHVARKSAATLKAPALADVSTQVSRVRKGSPIGATR